mmetsp:Transcript_2879/g.6749  ORF Transcript_2879/g.6749 Transcript_2879/m.6749 type:complete len:223 (-) Transcript_2879:13-681(-)
MGRWRPRGVQRPLWRPPPVPAPCSSSRGRARAPPRVWGRRSSRPWRPPRRRFRRMRPWRSSSRPLPRPTLRSGPRRRRTPSPPCRGRSRRPPPRAPPRRQQPSPRSPATASPRSWVARSARSSAASRAPTTPERPPPRSPCSSRAPRGLRPPCSPLGEARCSRAARVRSPRRSEGRSWCPKRSFEPGEAPLPPREEPERQPGNPRESAQQRPPKAELPCNHE